MSGKLDYKYLAKLVDLARKGDSDAFAELYAATYQKEYRFAYRYLNDMYLAQDALQETYITALKNLHKLKDSTLFISWLNQINFRTCFNLHTKQQQYDAELSEYIHQNIQQKATHHLPEDEIIRIDQEEYILKKVLELPVSESQVILMKYYQNMKPEEIADILDISRSTVKRYLKSGKAKLTQIIER